MALSSLAAVVLTLSLLGSSASAAPDVATPVPPPNQVELADAVRLVNHVSDKCLDVEHGRVEDRTPLIQWRCTPWAYNQMFSFKDKTVIGDFTYVKIVAKHSEKCLSVETNRPSNGARVLQDTCRNEASQWWYTHTEPDGRLAFHNLFTETWMGVAGSSKHDGTAVIVWAGGPDDQKWHPRKVTAG
ncbi:RICIN domain-containing protein [Streptoalloteichus hindustanus]|nr:RICIN domain-containing protein [Streptoalloteichus hindustanus]